MPTLVFDQSSYVGMIRILVTGKGAGAHSAHATQGNVDHHVAAIGTIVSLEGMNLAASQFNRTGTGNLDA
ncbi:hypothetical protein THITH_00235 [Thioalkalivibrio paradoxus ARh 1]|uniref:Uncharacterized protein n=1 Tax=Thioalkalivibrio paradoxus ARh 1 TaxID=713585 RepID=W0DSH6_9GAMM|nr:hypothetical protein THITH_00235 [Thioalkalivibrio paradoxus ARh 1]